MGINKRVSLTLSLGGRERVQVSGSRRLSHEGFRRPDVPREQHGADRDARGGGRGGVVGFRLGRGRLLTGQRAEEDELLVSMIVNPQVQGALSLVV